MGAGNIGIPPNYATGGDNRAFNITTIRWPINKTTGWTNSPGDCSEGVCEDMGGNIPLNSTHDGGVNTLFADGSVRFLTDNVPLTVLGMLATRDDGNPIPDF
jgi:prepilin-type processing-associated H-X9-DG protein